MVAWQGLIDRPWCSLVEEVTPAVPWVPWWVCCLLALQLAVSSSLT